MITICIKGCHPPLLGVFTNNDQKSVGKKMMDALLVKTPPKAKNWDYKSNLVTNIT